MTGGRTIVDRGLAPDQIARHVAAGRRAEPAQEPTGFTMRGLTARENEVLFWVTRGKTNVDISAILSVAPKTVEKHLEHVYAKLDVPNRAAAVAAAFMSAAISAD